MATAKSIGMPLTLSSGASVTVNADGSFTYVAPVNSSTPVDTITFTASDGVNTVAATATITVTSSSPTASGPTVNFVAPVANDGSFSVIHDQTITIDLSSIVTETKADGMLLQIVTGPQHGGVVVSGDTIEYIPASGYVVHTAWCTSSATE